MADNIPVLNLLYMDSHDVTLLILADISVYPTGFNIIAPTLAVTAPGYGEKQIPFDAGNVNIFNSNTLGIPCHTYGCPPVDLPDGAYTFKYAIFPAFKYNITKTFFRTNKIYAKFDEIFLNVELLDCDRQIKRNKKMKLDEAEFYIQGAISAGNKCALKLATELYRKADAILSSLNC